MDIVPFNVTHLDAMVLQQAQQGMAGWVENEQYKVLEGPDAFSILDWEGRPMFCGGIAEVWPDRAQAWSMFDEDAGKMMAGITRATRRFFDMQPYRRIECFVDCEFLQAHRWARMLGFTLEAECMRSFYPNGQDVALYARIK